MGAPEIIGVDIGGTKCAVSRLDPDGRVRETARFGTEGPRQTIDRLLAEAAALGPGRDCAFGIASGGPMDAAAGLLLSPPNLPGWDRVEIVRAFRDRFGGPAFLMNDANACALAEWQFGAGRGCRSMVFLTAGTGMGSGLILDGRLHEGVTGNAGEAGHVRLAPEGPVGYRKAGSFEGFCSGGGIAQLIRMRGRTEASAKDLAEAAERGDAGALELWREIGTKLGEALAILIDILNPERIVIGSIYVRSRKFLEAAMREALAREALDSSLADCRILPAELGEEIGNYAAVAIARYHMGERTPGGVRHV